MATKASAEKKVITIDDDIYDTGIDTPMILEALSDNGVLTLSSEESKEVARIYAAGKNTTSEDASKFSRIIDGAVINGADNLLIRFIGEPKDDSFFYFKVMNRLKSQGVKIEIVMSRHDMSLAIVALNALGEPVTVVAAGAGAAGREPAAAEAKASGVTDDVAGAAAAGARDRGHADVITALAAAVASIPESTRASAAAALNALGEPAAAAEARVS